MTTEAAVPERSLEQRLAALRRANATRSYRSRLKLAIRNHERSALEVLVAPAPQVLTMKVYELLMAMPKVGRVKAGRWLKWARISPNKTLGGLSDRQRAELVAIITGHRPAPVL